MLSSTLVCGAAMVGVATEAVTSPVGIALALTSSAFGLGVFVGCWAILRRSLRRLRTQQEDSSFTLALALDGIRVGAVVERHDSWPLDLDDAVTRLAREHGDLRRTIEHERLQSSFSRDLTEALELSDSESEVFATAGRAADMALSGRFHVICTDEEGDLSWEVTRGTPACACPKARNCPALRKGRTLEFHPGGGLARCAQLSSPETHAICVPVSAAGQTIAIAQSSWEGSGRDDLKALESLSTALGARLGVVRTLDEREQQASTDPLTGLANRRHMGSIGEELDEGTADYAVIACDLDHFKKLNDTWGHDCGDRCLKLFARVLSEVCRQADTPCRPGGEEFTVVLPESSAMNAVIVAERIRVRLAQAVRGSATPFTVSMGVAGREHGDTFENTLCLADAALYTAKESGRDRVSLYGSLEEVAA
ncbi:MAG: GGDEF domain-containing protein [Proteobacteria bacterium]|nr:GGDEF domain-containing protein [Pseudomonadota bacterium]MCP4917081.1 GGDEF domain-containing protein [Pseudomonadota bacterium]